MTSQQMAKITQDAIGQLQYDKYGLSDGLLSVRFVDETDSGTWRIAFWLKGDVGTEIHLAVSSQAPEEFVRRRIIQEIEAHLPSWRKLVTS